MKNAGRETRLQQVDSHFCEIKRRCSFLSNFAQYALEIGNHTAIKACAAAVGVGAFPWGARGAAYGPLVGWLVPVPVAASGVVWHADISEL